MTDPAALKEIFDETPFINGGLFECLDDLEGVGEGGERVDCFTDNTHQREELSVPNSLFFDEEHGGLFNLFDRYKFTVEENTPIEQEVALDPELLGKVFENLLAEMNPETRDTARKMTGSYYTPRAVVNYMTKEALAAALAQKVQPDDENAGGYWRDNLDVLLDDEEEWDEAGDLFSDAEKRRLTEGINDLKILDPAVGSGAFPMAALLKLTTALRRLEQDNGKNDYERKLRLIQNNIFGVDIQRIACQIAKLRFFVTLAIEQESNKDPNDNYGFEPLPNLETRFVAADALLPLHPQDSDRPIEKAEELEKKNKLEREIHENRQEYFPVNERPEKKRLKRKNKKLRRRLSKQLKKMKWTDEAAERIAHWDAFSQTDDPADWFDPEYMFGVRDGFDVVIGNPPYVQLQKKQGELGKKYQDAGFETFARTGDIYCLFYEQALKLAAEGGCACLITSNSWLRAEYGRSLRGYFVDNHTPVRLLDVGKDIFDAIVDANILILRKGKSGEPCLSVDMDTLEDKAFPPKHDHWNQTRIDDDNPWSILSPLGQSVTDKMREIGEPLSAWNLEMNRGVTTGCNDAFIIDNATRDALINEDSRSQEILKPVLRGRDIKRWRNKWAGLWLINARKGVEIASYPAVHAHLKRHYDKLSSKSGSNEWYQLQASTSDAVDSRFRTEKLIWMDLTDQGRFSYNEKGDMYCINTGFVMTGSSLKYICAVLNSKIMAWYMKNTALNSGMGVPRWIIFTVQRLPIARPPTPEVESALVLLVDAILSKKASDPGGGCVAVGGED